MKRRILKLDSNPMKMFLKQLKKQKMKNKKQKILKKIGRKRMEKNLEELKKNLILIKNAMKKCYLQQILVVLVFGQDQWVNVHQILRFGEKLQKLSALEIHKNLFLNKNKFLKYKMFLILM